MNYEEIIKLITESDMIGDQDDVKVWLNTMSQLDKDILIFIANEGYFKGYEDGYYSMSRND